MRVLAITSGTRGDLDPYLALGHALRSRGHELTLGASRLYADAASRHGLAFVPLPDDSFGGARSAVTTHTADRLDKLDVTMMGIARMVPAYVKALLPAIAEVDVVIGGVGGMVSAAQVVAEHHRKPFYGVCLNPLLLRSPWYASHFQIPPDRSLFDGSERSRRVNSMGWLAFDTIIDRYLRDPFNAARVELGRPPVPRFRLAIGMAQRVVVPIDREILPLPPETSVSGVEQTSQMRLVVGDQLSGALVEFLAAGPPPVYIGFGSMPSANPARTAEIVRAAIRSVGCRAVIRGGNSIATTDLDGADCFVIDEARHDLLFPRVAAVVHHGGTGTTGTAAWAGVPQIIVPHAFDQFYYAHRITELGIGEGMHEFGELEAALAPMLARVTTDPNMQRRAREMGEALRTRDGSALTAELIEAWYREDRRAERL